MDEKIIEIIVNGAKSAGAAIKQFVGRVEVKDLSKVTDFDYGIPADKKAEEIILTAIRESGLNCRIISEEIGIIDKEGAEYNVYVDPVDGSVNFSRGIPTFCIGIGIYSSEDEPLVGIIYDPNQDELFVAEKGKGATLNGNRILPRFFKKNVLINLEWFGADDCPSVVEKLKKNNFKARIAGCGVLALCYGCIGRGDAAILLQNKPWDIAPGMVFAKELGYTIKQTDGSEVDLNKMRQNIISAPEVLFDEIFNCIK